MAKWRTADAKQQFSELLRRSEEEPQLIYRRDHLVAALISAEDFAELERARDARQRETLGQRFDEIRQICALYDYELDTGERSDREGWSGEGDS
ncbi:MAG TPA: type II toxin-antitoxin system Phd/YefM family antitoxin [Thermoanaerobaculia bacterium]|jgi:prevent-host-death family protein|nr:type II toxin-antitoxin system Phd/YefM family antitoxin [Thermoanaerobaculia bacterium]